MLDAASASPGPSTEYVGKTVSTVEMLAELLTEAVESLLLKKPLLDLGMGVVGIVERLGNQTFDRLFPSLYT